MKKNKKKDIKRIYRKRIWPSIALFFIFLGICGVMFYTSVYMFEEYFVEAKIGNMQEEAKNLGRMITSHMENETVLDAVAYLEEYLGEERDVCVTDEEGRVLAPERYYRGSKSDTTAWSGTTATTAAPSTVKPNTKNIGRESRR